VLSIGDEGLGAVEGVAVAGLDRSGPHALQIRAGARFGHRDGTNEFAGRELWQPTSLLVLGAIVQDVGRDNPRMQWRAEGIKAGKAALPVDDGLMGETPARTAVIFGH